MKRCWEELLPFLQEANFPPVPGKNLVYEHFEIIAPYPRIYGRFISSTR
jgi:hypothetical protein